MSRLLLHLLGSFQALLDGAPVTGFESDKVRALLAYLAAESDRPHRRQALAALLWPDRPEPDARRNLRGALFSLRHAIADQDAQVPHLLVTPQTVQYNPAGDHWEDANELVALAAACAAHEHPHPDDCSTCMARLQQAASLYRGSFLAGLSVSDSAPFEQWALSQREHLQRLALLALGRLAACYEQRGAYDLSVQTAWRQLDLDPLQEQVHRQLMRSLALAGRRSEALAQYEVCVRVLAHELDAAPDTETTALYARIREGVPVGASRPEAPLLPEAERAQERIGTLDSDAAAETELRLLHQLPPSPGDFVGRETELRALWDAVQREGVRLLAIRGLGGMGKTSLALRLSESLTEHYPDAQFYIDLRGMHPQPLTPAEAMAHVIHSYHPLAPLPESWAALAALYRSVLQGQRALLLLDNVRDRAQVEPLLPPASCLLVLTARWRFTLPGLRTLDLEAQTPQEATHWLRAMAPRLAEQEALALAQACGALPLALRVAGSALAEREDLPVEDDLAQLRTAQGRLPAELEEVASSLALSDALLGDALRARWYALAVFPESFARGGAQAVWGLASAPEAQPALGELLRYNLLEYDPSSRRYRLHELCRAYATVRLGPAAAAVARARHAAYYAQVFQEADRQYVASGFVPGALDLFDRERANILAGQSWAASRAGESAEGARRYLAYVPPALGSGLVLIRLLAVRLAAEQRVLWWDAGLRAARQVGDLDAEMRCLLWLAMARRELGHFRPFRDEAQQALGIARALGDRGGEAAALHQLSVACGTLEGPARAIPYSERCLAFARELGWPLVQALADRMLASHYLELEEPQRGLAYARRAWDIVRDMQPPPPHRSYVLQICGQAHTDVGDPHRGLEHLESALALFREWGLRHWEGITLTCMGRAYRALGDLGRAREQIEHALAIGQEVGARAAVAEALDELGQLCSLQGDGDATTVAPHATTVARDATTVARALSYYEQALQLWDEVGSPLGEARTLAHMAMALDMLGEGVRAGEAAHRALALFTQLEHPAAERVRRQLAQWEPGAD